MSSADINEVIKANRLTRFKSQVGNYWDVDDVLMSLCFKFVIAASDNNAKNFYPYTFGVKKIVGGVEVETDDALFRVRDDDLDTIKPADNQGADRKPYYVEWFDKDADGNYYYNAAKSGFMKLFLDAYFKNTTDEGYVMMRRVLSGLETLGGSSAGSHLDRLMAWHKKYYEDVKDAFPAALVNEDMMRYERAKIAQMKGLYNEVDPLTQELGDHKSTERAWMKKRFVYLMSMFSFGDFAHGATSGTITFRLNGTANITLKPAIAMYPTADAGQTIIRGARTMAGGSCSLSWSGTDLDSSVLGADWLTDIGEWYNMPIRNVLAVNARMLKHLLLGTDDPAKVAAMAIQISSLTLNCAALRELDLRNISTMQGEVDIRGSKLLQTVRAGGTQLSSLLLADGCPVSTIEYPTTEQSIFLRDLPLLENSGVNYMACARVVTRFIVSNCSEMEPLRMLADIINAQSSQATHALQRVYVDGFDETSTDAGLLDTLTQLLSGYQAVNRDGYDVSGLPVLSGTLRMDCAVYMDLITQLLTTFGPGGLNIVFNSDKLYIRFEDSRVWEICAYNWGDTRLVSPGSVFATGEIEADGSALVVSDHVFASCLVHPARTYSDGTAKAQVAAAARTFEVELQFDSATPFSSIAAGSTVIEIRQYASNTSTQVVVGTLAKEDVVLDSDNKLTITTSGTTNACQYLTVAVLADNGVKATYTFKVASTSASGIYQPVGITQAQCAVVSSLGTVFDGAQIYRFREFKLFVSCTGVQSAWQSQFYNCPIQIIETPLNYKDWGYQNFPAACCVIAHASTYNSGRTRWTARYYFVQDEYIGNFPENSKILKWSEFPTYYPDEKAPTF